MLALAPDGGRSSHTAVMSRSTPTGLLRLISSMANTARCLGVPNGTNAPSTLISNGPSRPSSRRLSTIALTRPSGFSYTSFHTRNCDTKFRGFGANAGLGLGHRVVGTPAGEQLVVVPLFDDPARLHHHNAIGVADGRKTMRDNETRSVLAKLTHGPLNERLGAGVHRAGRFVQD